LGKSVATLADFKVNPSITIQTCERVFVDELLWNVQDFDANVFRLGHGRVKVEVLKVDGAKACTFLQEDTVKEKLEEFQGCCVGTHISRVADAVATHGDLCAVRVVLFRSDFTNHHGVAYFLPLVQREVVVVDAKVLVLATCLAPLSRCLGRDSQAHLSARYPMSTYT
jgi:hypothetical protein